MQTMKTEAPMFDAIAAKVRRQRQYQGLTQAELATKAGLTLSAIAKAEDGLHTHHLATLRKIAWALAVDVQVLVG
jgi:transcriptional regulator with XRE-family HTH domain